MFECILDPKNVTLTMSTNKKNLISVLLFRFSLLLDNEVTQPASWPLAGTGRMGTGKSGKWLEERWPLVHCDFALFSFFFKVDLAPENDERFFAAGCIKPASSSSSLPFFRSDPAFPCALSSSSLYCVLCLPISEVPDINIFPYSKRRL